MKKMLNILLIVAVMALSFTGCADRKEVHGVTYETYGLLNMDDNKNPNIQYELQWGNIVWAILLVEFFFIPTIYFLGFSLWEPIGPKVTDPNLKGVVAGEENLPQNFNTTVYSE